MTITKHNYEEFFLLYVDNELNAQEKKAVEDFVANNPELGEELEMLLQTQLQAPLLTFDKTDLYKPEVFDEALLVQYLDNELNDEERRLVEQATEDEKVAKELALLKRTILTPEIIPFKDKKILYREETRVIPIFHWRRLLAAATVLLIAGLFWVNMNNPSTVAQTNLVVQENAKENSTNHDVTELPQKPEIKVSEKETLAKNENPDKQSETKKYSATKQVDNTKQIPLENIAEVTKRQTETVIENEPITKLVAQTDLPNPEKVLSPVKPLILNEDDFVGANKEILAAVEPGLISGDEIQEKENKLNGNIRGFFRKTSRIINRSKVTEPDTEEENRSVVRIASFAIAKK